MKKLNTNRELVIMAPIQIKSNLSVGNIFDLTLIDFYVKSRKLSGINVFSPFLWNINGEPLVKQVLESGIKFTEENVNKYINNMIEKAKKKMKEHYIDFDIFLRDDQILVDIKRLTKKKYLNTFNLGIVKLSKCSKCDNIFGSDPLIRRCKFCGSIVNYVKQKTLFKTIKKKDIVDKVNSITFYPEATRQKLIDFINKMPDKYNLILEKERKYTLKYKGIKLDPRFITMMFPAILSANKYNNITWIHGDVVKKFDYYSLCYLNEEDCPDKIISHGLVLGTNKKKIRWQDDNAIKLELIERINNKILRAYFLKHNINTNLVIDLQTVQSQIKGLIRLYVKIKRVLEKRNLSMKEKGIRLVLNKEITRFYKNVELFKFAKAFNNMEEYANLCWKITKDSKLSKKEQESLLNLKNIYFGE